MNNRNNINGRASNPSAPDLSLTPTQLDLLSTALSSNRSLAMPNLNSNASNRELNTAKPAASRANSNPNQGQKSLDANLTNTEFYTSPAQESSGSVLNGSEEFDSPFLDYDIDDANYDWDTSAGLLIGSLPGGVNEEENDLHEKRKPGVEDEEEGAHKRREGEDRSAKKPGRKPMTGEPTTKRKAQNRAAQRAFRERKERHLKELETKVEELEKASESTNHENGRLRAQVGRLNTELSEYKKRLSLSGTGTGRSQSSGAPQQTPAFWNANQPDFQFAFPKFGDLPGSNFMSNGSLAKVGSSPNRVDHSTNGVPAVMRANSSGSVPASSPTNLSGSSKSGSSDYAVLQSPSHSQFNDYKDINGLFRPSTLGAANRSNSLDYVNYNNGRQLSSADKYGNMHRGSTLSNVTSPSASSASNNGLDSSCGTTPEPSADSPDSRKASEPTLNTINEEILGQRSYQAPSSVLKSPLNDVNGIDWMAQQNGGQFDPVLFGDYRDPHDNILTNYGGFFNEAFPFQDFSNPFNTGEIIASPYPKRDLMKEVETQQNGADDDLIAPSTVENEDRKPITTCTKLWDRMQNSERVRAGEVDIDSLCSQLKAKAKCTGSGRAIDPQDIDDILGPEPQKPIISHEDLLKMFR